MQKRSATKTIGIPTSSNKKKMAAKKIDTKKKASENVMPNKNKILPTKQYQEGKKHRKKVSKSRRNVGENDNERIKNHMRRSTAKCVDNFCHLNLMDMIEAFHYLRHAITPPNDNNHCNICNFTDTLSSFCHKPFFFRLSIGVAHAKSI